MTPLLYILFFCSGISGLIYQVVWVREFGHAFGNTIHSASLVVAIFMLGLGVGSYVVGVWADRRYQRSPESLLRVYAFVEALIAVLALGVSLLLPHLDSLVAAVSSYSAGSNGWFVLSPASYLFRASLALVLLSPITLLMGGTLTLLIRYLVRADVSATGWIVAALYGVNTAGAAAGAFLTDFALVPTAGLFLTQMTAVGLNLVAALGAFALVRMAPDAAHASEAVRSRRNMTPVSSSAAGSSQRGGPTSGASGQRRQTVDAGSGTRRRSTPPATAHPRTLVYTASALALSGFAAMGLEILWLRHFTLLLGGFRAVFSLLLGVMLIALGIGALLGGWVDRRRARPAESFMVVQGLFVAAALFGLASADAQSVAAAGSAIGPGLRNLGPAARVLTELWYDIRPMLFEVGVPALLAGFLFPLANAMAQRAEQVVGRQAGVLYLANTAGAVCGSLLTGYLLLPQLGLQGAGTVLALAAALAIIPVSLTVHQRRAMFAGAAVAALAIAAWLTLPGDYVVARALLPQQAGERVVSVSEGTTELIAVVERPDRARGLLTNGHAMSSTAPLDQRYMRALAHVPLLAMPSPKRVLVIGFGVGNTTHAAALHPSVERVEVADLSRHILEHASYFEEANHGVIANPKVSVYLNDGRQHLQMAQPATYDLITLEPPPIAHAGVGALYSREFYQLARSRLAAGGYVSQWLPAYQVPSASSLAMVRAFVDVFPQAVLLSGTEAELLLIGTTAPRIEVDPDRLQAALDRAPDVRADLARLDLGTPRDIVGTFVASAETLTRATRQSPAMTDDRPIQEYEVRSVLGSYVTGVPASLFEVSEVGAWCPRCFDGDYVAPSVAGLDLYLGLLEQAYTTTPGSRIAAAGAGRLLGSAYLARVVPDTPEVRRVLGVAHLRAGSEQLQEGRYSDAVAELNAAVGYMPDMAEAHNDLGVALASMGRIAEARDHFGRAVALQPDFAEARRNLAAAR